MSIHDEQDLRAQLGAALDELTPRPLPLESVIRKGTAVMIRRRLAVVAGVVVVAAAAIATPTLLHHLGRQPSSPVAPLNYRVSVYPPGPGSPEGLIASGRIDGRRWRVIATRTRLSGKVNLCFDSFDTGCEQASPPRGGRSGNPAEFFMRISGRPDVEIGMVRADVAYLRVGLTNGQTLTLRPVPVFGRQHAGYVAIAMPDAAAVTQVSAYSADGELAHAVPFTALGSIRAVRWLRPGEPALPHQARYRLWAQAGGGGPTGSEYAYTGPWGSCIGGVGWGFTCAPVGLEALHGRMTAHVTIESGGPGGYLVVVAVSPSLRYLRVTADGHTLRVKPVRAGTVWFCTFMLRKGYRSFRLAAHYGAGKREIRLVQGSVP